MTDPPATLASTAYASLRADLINGVIPAGRRIRIRPLCERLGIGLSPTREALNRLSSEGLVQQDDQRGFTAAALNPADLADLTQARAAINAAALRDAIAHGDQAWEEAIVLAHHRLVRSSSLPVSAEQEGRHRAFHAALLAACRSERLRAYSEHLFDAADRYRIASRQVVAGVRDTAAEHSAIMAAVLDRNTARAVALLEAHVLLTEQRVRAAKGW